MTHLEAMKVRLTEVPLSACPGELDLVRPSNTRSVYRCRACGAGLVVADGVTVRQIDLAAVRRQLVKKLAGVWTAWRDRAESGSHNTTS